MLRSLQSLLDDDVPFRILGGGSNLLIADSGIHDVVLSTRGLSRVFRTGDDARRLNVEAGVSLPQFVSMCHRTGLKGAESLTGIPGTVGGAAIMNSGGRHGSIGSLIRGATVLDRSGRLEEREIKPEEFGYRSSPLKGQIIVDVIVELEGGEKDKIWERMSEILAEKRSTQPLTRRSCGCVFKNPAADSAGRLLDSAGMKGMMRGKAEVSELHANFILNRGGCSFEDYYSLITDGRKKVMENHGISLEMEVEIWPPQPSGAS